MLASLILPTTHAADATRDMLRAAMLTPFDATLTPLRFSLC